MTDDRRTGYATENVTPITALEQSTIEALWGEVTASLHSHDASGPSGCPICRDAERVSARFPEHSFTAVDRPEGETFG